MHTYVRKIRRAAEPPSLCLPSLPTRFGSIFFSSCTQGPRDTPSARAAQLGPQTLVNLFNSPLYSDVIFMVQGGFWRVHCLAGERLVSRDQAMTSLWEGGGSLSLSLSFLLRPVSRMAPPSKPGPAQGLSLLKGRFVFLAAVLPWGVPPLSFCLWKAPRHTFYCKRRFK